MLLMLQIIGVGIFRFILRVILLGLISVLNMLLQLYLKLQGLLIIMDLKATTRIAYNNGLERSDVQV